MSLVINNFQFEEILTAVDLNQVNSNMDTAVEEVGRAYSEIFGDYGVIGNEIVTFDKIFIHDFSEGRYWDFTNPARSNTITPDFPGTRFFTWNAADEIYIGLNRTFDDMTWEFSSPASSSAGPAFRYWNGTGWNALTVTDGTNGFQNNGQMTWTIPSNWITVDLNTANETFRAESSRRFWIQIAEFGNSNTFLVDSIVTDLLTGTNDPSLKVKVTNPLSLSVLVNPGAAIVDGKFVIVSNTVPVGLVRPSTTSQEWQAAIQLTKEGEIVVDYGDEAGVGLSVPKNARVDAIKLADVNLEEGIVNIADADITDQRLFLDT